MLLQDGIEAFLQDLVIVLNSTEFVLSVRELLVYLVQLGYMPALLLLRGDLSKVLEGLLHETKLRCIIMASR